MKRIWEVIQTIGVIILVVGGTVFFIIVGANTNHNEENPKTNESEDNANNPHATQSPERIFYGDSVYLISKKIDTVYSYGQWIDQEHIRRKRRADSLRRLLQTKKTD